MLAANGLAQNYLKGERSGTECSQESCHVCKIERVLLPSTCLHVLAMLALEILASAA